MPKFKVQYYGPTFFIEAETEEDAKDFADEYMEGVVETLVCEAEQDDTIPDDLLLTRD